ncbi:hypothetical protein K474DRAFT_1655788 [Panus rudis PR-1116 ss-1]|nr:hypothetical protein K474DRAFT_1655788 [Panus rudis PR-1116 ss-1]
MNFQPATPTVVPATPTPTRGSSSKGAPESYSSGSSDVFYDAEDSDLQTKRRSIYRAPGTASSPDLATLLRKAKAREGQSNKAGRSGSNNSTNNNHGSPAQTPLTPNRLRADGSVSTAFGTRQRPPSSQNSSPARETPLTKGRLRGQPQVINGGASPDWVLTSPRSMASIRDGAKNNKSSVRQKAAAFFGGMLGASSTRERSRTVTSSPSNPSYSPPQLFHALPPGAPPVPPLPNKVKRHTSIASENSDVFSNPASSANQQKPLPEIHRTPHVDREPVTEDLVDESIVMVQRGRSPSPTATVTRGNTIKPLNTATARRNRRSMSVSDVELKKVMAGPSTYASSPLGGNRASHGEKRSQDSEGWASALSGIITDFRGELDTLDPPLSAPLDLRDPSYPSSSTSSHSPPPDAGKPLSRTKSDNVTNGTLQASRRPTAKTSVSSPADSGTSASTSTSNHKKPMTPRVTLQPASTDDSILDAVLSSPTFQSSAASSPNEPIVPPRTSSLLQQSPGSSSPIGTPGRSRSGSANAASPRTSGLRYGPRSPSGRSNLSIGHAPSPWKGEGNRLRVQHRSTASSSEPSLVPARDDGRVQPVFGAASQQDLSTNDPARARRNFSHSPARNGEDNADIETRGKELAARCWAEDDEFLAKDKIAEWLGGQSLINKVALRHYMDNFDFSGLRLDNAFRKLCAKLYLKAETQQVDRILEEFARRYWECNPTSIFGNASVVHAVTYSLLLLNTDLHVAELTNRMSRNQFVRNTLNTIQMQLQPTRPGSRSNAELTPDDWSSLRAASDTSENPSSTARRIKRSDSMTSWSSITREGLGPTLMMQASSGQLSTNAPSSEVNTNTAMSSGRETPINSSRVSVSSAADGRPAESSAPSIVYDRNWENEIESMLKEIYNSVKNQQILQPISSMNGRLSTSSLTAHGPMLRQRSLRAQPDRLTTLKRGSIRGLQSILTSQAGASPYSSNSSFDGRASPAPSFATSHEGLHGSAVSFLAPTLGFASNLSHTIIREAQEDDNHSMKSDQSLATDISITDEELALLGPPWAKEGMLCRKQYWESAGKRAKSKNWMDVFVVIQKGELSMFVFGDHGGGGGGGIVGGGNWLENAEPVGTIQLAHSLAHALPPPGYNRQRPHCMVLTLSNGASYFFQAGTEELVNEWVSTCNYWAARQSKEPLAGGVSNMEYGWNRVMDPVTRARSASEDQNTHHDDDAASVRSGRSRFSKKDFAATMRADKSPWHDRIVINEWKPPMPPSVSSMHDEETQLEALRKHVAALKDELQEHNELRTPMIKLYSPRSANANKAMTNWEKKSQYLLAEIVKYESYIDSLQSAMALRLKKRGEKALERALVAASPSSDDGPTLSKGKWRGHPSGETIEEGEEPPASAGLPGPSPNRSQFHRREVAEVDDDDDDDSTDDDS